MDAGATPNFCSTPTRPEAPRAPVELDDTVAAHTLREILVGRAHDDLLDARVGRGHGRRRGQRIVGLEVDHGPDDDAERAQRLLQRPKLPVQERVHPLARLVLRPECVAERFDHVIGGHADMGRAASSIPKIEPTTPRTARSSSGALRSNAAAGDRK